MLPAAKVTDGVAEPLGSPMFQPPLAADMFPVTITAPAVTLVTPALASVPFKRRGEVAADMLRAVMLAPRKPTIVPPATVG